LLDCRTPGCARKRSSKRCHVEFGAEQFFDELARSSPHFGLKRIKPVVEKIAGNRPPAQRIRFRSSVRHRVVAGPTLKRWMIRD
jgi:hypothetical protein